MSTARTPRAGAGKPGHRPDDQPFEFNLDTAEPPRELAPFTFHWHGRRWTMRHLEELDVWEVVQAAEGGDIQAMTGAFKLALGQDWEAFRAHDLPQWRFMALFRAYRDHCGVDVDPDGSPADGAL